MRKILTSICILMLAALFPAAMMVSRDLPADTRTYIESKYAGWNGVLQAWICSRWSTGSGFISWLNGCAADFEKNRDGVFIEFTPVDENALRDMRTSGIPMPDMIFFSPGMLNSDTGLLTLESTNNLRKEFRDFESCLPVAMGGYIWVYNRALCAKPVGLPQMMLPDDDGRRFSTALETLMETASEEEMEIEPPGLDLGLPAASLMPNTSTSAEALEAFINGEISHTIITQKELARLVRLQESGRGPDWDCHAAGSSAWGDQLLLAAIPVQADGRSPERSELCREFIDQLTGSEAQAELTRAGAFSVSGAMIYPAHSPYADLDALLSSRRLELPAPFSEHSAQHNPTPAGNTGNTGNTTAKT